MRCPCRSRKLYKRCCKPWHEGLDSGRFPPTPEALMRSRYAAYALGLAPYIVATSDPPQDLAGVQQFCEHTRFTGLRILEAPEALVGVGFVSFQAGLEQGGQDASFSERSRFERRGPEQRWVYVGGERLGG